jgi:HSF-type DNA-binding
MLPSYHQHSPSKNSIAIDDGELDERRIQIPMNQISRQSQQPYASTPYLMNRDQIGCHSRTASLTEAASPCHPDPTDSDAKQSLRDEPATTASSVPNRSLYVDRSHILPSIDNAFSGGFQQLTSKANSGPTKQRFVLFPIKLYNMLDVVDRDGHSHIVSWQPSGRCFKIHQAAEFEQNLLPIYFQGTT